MWGKKQLHYQLQLLIINIIKSLKAWPLPPPFKDRHQPVLHWKFWVQLEFHILHLQLIKCWWMWWKTTPLTGELNWFLPGLCWRIRCAPNVISTINPHIKSVIPHTSQSVLMWIPVPGVTWKDPREKRRFWCLLLDDTGEKSDFLCTFHGVSNTADVRWIYWDLQGMDLSHKGKRI